MEPKIQEKVWEPKIETEIARKWEESGIYDFIIKDSNYTIDTAPIPTNPTVELVNIKGGYFAVITYSGRLTDSNFNKHKNLLKEKITEDGIEIVGKEIKATYNSPYTLPVFRRNEVMMRIIFDEKA